MSIHQPIIINNIHTPSSNQFTNQPIQSTHPSPSTHLFALEGEAKGEGDELGGVERLFFLGGGWLVSLVSLMVG